MTKKLSTLIIAVIFFIFAIPARANLLIDSDLDAVPDKDEIEIYHTDPYNRDTDGDGYGDWIELVRGYSPLISEPKKLEECDYDKDGLSDRMELNFGTDVMKPDTDGDGFLDGEEIAGGYDPLRGEKTKLSKRIEINITKQELSYFLGNVKMGAFPVSSGVRNTTPRGTFAIYGKALKAWSSYGLWMPYWMALSPSGLFGIHELPYWPNGYREGADHLGRPVSHGCVRLGIGPAKFMYDWAETGTKVFIY